MAFLCPARRKRSRVKIRGPRPLEAPLPGRITGSDSIDTLVRVGLEKEQGPRARMVVLHDFKPCVDDELSVKRGQEVHVLYQENDWMYVISDEGKEGFIPYTYCLPVQRCAEDFVTPETNSNSNKKKINKNPTSNKHSNNGANKHAKNEVVKQNTKPTYQFATITKTGKPLTRKSSKSLPDISSSASKSNQSRYPVDNTNQNKYIFDEEEDKTYGMSLTRQSRTMHRRARSVSNDPSSSSRPSSARAAQSQPTSPVRSTDYTSTYNQRSQSNPGTPRITRNYINSVYSSNRSHNFTTNYNRHSTGSDLMQHSWNPSSGQSLMGDMNLAASYPVNELQSNRYPSSYQHSPSSQISQTLSYNSNFSNGYNRTHISSHDNSNLLVKLQQQKSQVEAFEKQSKGEYIVLFSFSPHQENDITVERGEFVTVLNNDDNDWLWVRRSDGQEGFVPVNYVMKIEPVKNAQSSQTSNIPMSNNYRSNNTIPRSNAHQNEQLSQQNPSSSSSNNYQFVSSSQYHNNSNGYQFSTSRHNSSSSNNQMTSSRLNSNGSSHQMSPRHNSSNQPMSSNINHYQNNTQHQLSASINPTSNLSPGVTGNHLYQQQNTNSDQVQNTSGATRIMCLYNYAARAPDDLTITQGEWLYANLSQADPDWLWVYSTNQRKSGYVPRNYTKAPNYGTVNNNTKQFT